MPAQKIISLRVWIRKWTISWTILKYMISSTTFPCKWPLTTKWLEKDCEWSLWSKEKSTEIAPDPLVLTIQMSWISQSQEWTLSFGKTSQISEKIRRKSKITLISHSSIKSTVNTLYSIILPQILMSLRCLETNISKQKKMVFSAALIKICPWSFWIRISRGIQL